MVTLRMPPDLIADVERWAIDQNDLRGRSEAVRRLVEMGLEKGTRTLPSHRLQAAHADRAKDLASKTIENIMDPTTPPDERDQRRRRLTKGPMEFRNGRLDQPKPKRK
jgi:hypothetical protein